MLTVPVHHVRMQKNSINSIESRILQTRFACDLSACKGACCTFPGGYGAPILEEEVPRLHEALAVVRSVLPETHVAVIDRDGLVERHGKTLHIRCVDRRACVFVVYEGDIAVCSIQRAYERGAFGWMKPISCHLFPIRVSRAQDTVTALRFEEFSECTPALANGEKSDTRLADFLAPALARAFGQPFSDALREEAARTSLPR